MRANPSWLETLISLAALLATAAVIGLAVGHVFLWLWLATLGYLAWYLRYVLELDRWLQRAGARRPPEAPGIWGAVFDRLYQSQKRHRARRRRLANLLGRFQESANAMPDAVVVLGRHDMMEWWNSTAARMFGLRWPQDAGQRIDNLFRHPQFRAFLEDAAGKEAVTLPSPVQAGAVLEIRIVPYGEGQRLLLARDITRLHKLELMRRDFVANVSHELRTPLTVIHGLAETMADSELATDPEHARTVELLQEQAQRMRRLVDDFLLLSRLETTDAPLRTERVDVPRLLQGLAEEAGALSGARHSIKLDLDMGLGLLGDESELRSAFSNIIVNAVKYTPPGGAITVRWQRTAGGARMEVVDTGPGIPAAHLPRLTERFYRIDGGRSAKTGGSGLGLAIVKHVLNRHQAKLQIDSKPGTGSSFRCAFPDSRVVSLDAAALK
jgi:two-component system phosphate regulon sensor histidine kinase PhoR